mmetsp:Transcript_28558/g.27530  ORF Transcript_28558/g.27530 Transcript_28558/m.27530 type:complete len:176 (+) Transcript_28558:586-1113(+)
MPYHYWDLQPGAVGEEFYDLCIDLVVSTTSFIYYFYYAAAFGVIIAFINIALTLIVHFGHPLMRYKNVTDDGVSAMITLCLAIYINTCVPILVVNMDLSDQSWVKSMSNRFTFSIAGIDYSSDILFNGSYTDTSREWMNQISTSLVSTFVIQWFFSVVFSLIKVPVFYCRRSCKK